ncbi:hypothetical protein [Alicyclobacillus sp.]|uniref:hypothetical protein n=1 Tax=Alicyclobacillus sp. TaxID=61169 RepID=UPI0025BD2125|nr:hypothetical protein [Alicyclobacillus sp.]MCL6515895.1 hypothetical protein [Alicyclobacillus sp.]
MQPPRSNAKGGRDIVRFVIHHEDPDSRPDWVEEMRSDAVYEGATRARLERTSDDGLTVTAPRWEFQLWARVAAQNGADVRILSDGTPDGASASDASQGVPAHPDQTDLPPLGPA